MNNIRKNIIVWQQIFARAIRENRQQHRGQMRYYALGLFVFVVCLIYTAFWSVAQEVAPAANPVPAENPAGQAAASVEFGKQISPLFARNCVACHNAKKAEGGLNLESHSATMKGGDSGASVIAGKAAESVLLQRIIDKDDPMPPAGNSVGAKPLTEAEVELVRSWIAAGALAPTAAEAMKLNWQPLPPSVHPINAVASSNDGNYLAIGRGNQAYVIRNPAISSLDQAYALVDPAVAEVLKASGANVDSANGAAQLDIVQSIAFSPDSSRVAVGGYRSVKIWRRNSGPVESIATGIASSQNSIVAISPDGLNFAISSDGKPVEIINLKSSQSHRFLKSHVQTVTALGWIDSGVLISCDASGAYLLTRVATNEVQPLSGNGLVSAKSLLTLTADKFLAVGADSKLYTIALNVPGNSLEMRVVDGLDQVQSVAAGGSGAVAVGLASGVCRLINRDNYTAIREIKTAGPVQQVAVSYNGALIATSTGSASAQLWRSEDGNAIAALDRDYRFTQMVAIAQRNVNRQQGLIDRLGAQHGELKKAVEAETAALAKVQESRDKAATELAAKETDLGTANAAVAEGQKAMAEAEAAVAAAMKMVETRKAELEAKQKAVAEATSKKNAAAEEVAKRDQALATSKDAQQRAAAKVPEMDASITTEKQRLEAMKKEADELAANPAAKHQAKQIAFAADSSRVAIADESGRVHLFSTTGGAPEANFETVAPAIALATTPSGRLISLTNNGNLQQWDAGLAWQLERIIGDFENSPFSDRITAMDFSPDGKWLAVGSGPPSRFGDIKIVDVATGAVAKDLGEVHSDSVLAIRYSPDGRKIASAGADKLCRILDAETGKQIVSLEGHTHHVLSVAWKDDGVTVATGSGDQTIKVWNVETATQIRTVAGAKKEITALAFLGQANQFMAVDASGTVRLIDAGNGNQVRAYAGADGAVLTVSISPDGKFVYSGGQSGNYWVWQVEDAKKLK
ncbi:MAG: c-type cytochrome domain-containing protein [Pirellulales bacterium]